MQVHSLGWSSQAHSETQHGPSSVQMKSLYREALHELLLQLHRRPWPSLLDREDAEAWAAGDTNFLLWALYSGLDTITSVLKQTICARSQVTFHCRRRAGSS